MSAGRGNEDAGPGPAGPDDDRDADGRDPGTGSADRRARLREARRALERLGAELEDTTRTLDGAMDVLPGEDQDEGEGQDEDEGEDEDGGSGPDRD